MINFHEKIIVDKIQNKSAEEYAMAYLENSKQIVEIEENLPEPWITLRVQNPSSG